MQKKNENQVVVTRTGHENLMAELVDLRTVRRLEVARQLEEARAFGDLSENAEYAAAKEEQSKVESRILELETMLSRIRIVDEDKLDTNRVAIGLTVTLEDLAEPGKSYTYTLVGSEELSSMGDAGSPIQRISQKSPVGQAILGHVAGDEVFVKIPRGTRHLKITDISRGDKGKDKTKPKPKPKAKAAEKDGAKTKAKAAGKDKAKEAQEAKEVKEAKAKGKGKEKGKEKNNEKQKEPAKGKKSSSSGSKSKK